MRLDSALTDKQQQANARTADVLPTTEGMASRSAARSAHDLFTTRFCPEAGCRAELPCSLHPALGQGGTPLAETLLLAALDAILRGGLEPDAPALAVAITRHPVLGRYDPKNVLDAI